MSAGLEEDVAALKAKARQALQAALKATSGTQELAAVWTKARSALHACIANVGARGEEEEEALRDQEEVRPPSEDPDSSDELADFKPEELEEAKRRARAALDAVLLVESGDLCPSGLPIY